MPILRNCIMFVTGFNIDFCYLRAAIYFEMSLSELHLDHDYPFLIVTGVIILYELAFADLVYEVF